MQPGATWCNLVQPGATCCHSEFSLVRHGRVQICAVLHLAWQAQTAAVGGAVGAGGYGSSLEADSMLIPDFALNSSGDGYSDWAAGDYGDVPDADGSGGATEGAGVPAGQKEPSGHMAPGADAPASAQK